MPTVLPSVTPASPTPARKRPQVDTLAQEVALLSTAIRALDGGRPADALKSLNQHERQFPNGVLNQDRRVAKAQALCSLRRVAEGRAELSELPAGTPAAIRAQQSCDATSLTTDR